MQAKKLPLSKFFSSQNREDLSVAASSISQNYKWGCRCKVRLLLIKKLKLWKNTTPFMTLTNNYAHAIMKQKKAKTDYLHGLSVFVFIVNELGPFEKPFHKLELHVSLGFPNTRKQKHEAKGSVLYQFSHVWKPWWNTRPHLLHLPNLSGFWKFILHTLTSVCTFSILFSIHSKEADKENLFNNQELH